LSFPNLGKTTNTEAFKRAIHLSRLMPLGKLALRIAYLTIKLRSYSRAMWVIDYEKAEK
jgi:hypothetical protein